MHETPELRSTEFGSRLTGFRPQVALTLHRAAQAIFRQPSLSFSQATGDSLRRLTADLLSDSRMTPEVLLHNHIEATTQRIESSEDQDIILSQDTVFLSYKTHTATKGLRPLQGKENLGIVQHNTLAVGAASGVPYGVVQLHNWTRGGHQDTLDKESDKWFAAVDQANQLSQRLEDRRFIVVQDREGDIFNHFKAVRAHGVHLVSRVCQARRYELLDQSDQAVGQAQRYYLKQATDHLPIIGWEEKWIYRQGKRVRLLLELKAQAVRVLPSKNKSARLHSVQGLNLVVATERDSFNEKGESIFQAERAAQWLLLSSLPIETLKQVAFVVHCYAMRWRVERLHYTMKSGALKVEALQFGKVQTLCNAIALHTIIAWRLMCLTYICREEDYPVEQCLESDEIKILELKSKEKIKTMQKASLAIAGLVNFKATKRQPWPGIKVMAQGLERLGWMTDMYRELNPPEL